MILSLWVLALALLLIILTDMLHDLIVPALDRLEEAAMRWARRLGTRR